MYSQEWAHNSFQFDYEKKLTEYLLYNKYAKNNIVDGWFNGLKLMNVENNLKTYNCLNKIKEFLKNYP